MSAAACEFCGSPAHVWFNCPKKPEGWKPERLKSTAARKDVHNPLDGRHARAESVGAIRQEQRKAAGTQAPPVDKKRGRPRIHPDRKAYKAEKERQRRAKLK